MLPSGQISCPLSKSASYRRQSTEMCRRHRPADFGCRGQAPPARAISTRWMPGPPAWGAPPARG